MPLHPIRPDPKPTPDEIQSQLAQLAWLKGPKWTDIDINRAAVFFAKCEGRKRNPDAYLEPFSTSIKSFPDGSENYTRYRERPLWKSIREKVLVAAGWKCCGCPATA